MGCPIPGDYPIDIALRVELVRGLECTQPGSDPFQQCSIGAVISVPERPGDRDGLIADGPSDR